MRFGGFKIARRVMFTFFLTGVLTACGNSNTGTTNNNVSETTGENGVKTESQTMSYTAINGEIQIPKDPKRVVVAEEIYVGDFLALGIKPVGVPQKALDNIYLKERLDGIQSIGDGKSTEKIMELKPDLIITFSGAENIDQLQKIAPTVAIEYGKKEVREQVREFGKMTNREDKANKWIANWDKKVAEAKPRVKASVGDKTVSILNPYSKGIYVFGHNFSRGGEILYNELKLKAPAIIQKEVIDSGQGLGSLSLETLPSYAGDYIFTTAWSGDDANPEVVYNSSIWKALPAVKNNRVFSMDKNSSVFNDPISLEGQLDFIVEKLTK
ncbi:iron-hydroxamate ABC transporter substrate-binding protein [Brevibacillus laterosporus]|uniref:iron-hydroxamate ABC transporter substrate-binding protein n=1 Tax=Brevibacillus laterosporus TaxID=1465 RepID=UPI000B9AD04A|nr:iron-hydroxamate ABC transporter substrate-binding protein [Brevibacillus laterosporus]